MSKVNIFFMVLGVVIFAAAFGIWLAGVADGNNEPKCWYEPQRVTELTYDQFHYRGVEVGRETPLLCGLLVEPEVDVGRNVCWEMVKRKCP